MVCRHAWLFIAWLFIIARMPVHVHAARLQRRELPLVLQHTRAAACALDGDPPAHWGTVLDLGTLSLAPCLSWRIRCIWRDLCANHRPELDLEAYMTLLMV